jgi:tetratricopeptide (TPR) repeat protein
LTPVYKGTSARHALANTLLAVAARVHGDRASRAGGMAYLLGDRFDKSIDGFGRIRVRSAADWNDLAAANVCAAVEESRLDRWLDALGSVDHALMFDPSFVEARFNRSKIIDALGIEEAARANWNRYLTLDPTSVWAQTAKQRLASFKPGDTEVWNVAVSQIDKLSPSELSRLTDAYPELARKYAEASYLSSWAITMAREQPGEARKYLGIARAIGHTLDRRGEPFIADVIRDIDLAGREPARLKLLIEAQLDYFKGRIALRDGDAIAAEKSLLRSSQGFAAAKGPMAGVAEFWMACALTIQNRSGEAYEVLTTLLSREKAAGGRYRALIGHVQYQLSLIEAFRGNWSASLAAALSSKAVFGSLRERENYANACALLSEDYDLLGQPDLSRKFGFEALRESAAAGALDRTRVILAALCRTELRGGEWNRGRSLASLEEELAPVTPDLRLDPDMFIRRATAEWHLANGVAAGQWLKRARDAAGRITDSATRTKLLADVDAAEGTFLRRSEPRRATTLLSAAIGFQKAAERPIILPELYLQRGRAYLGGGDVAAAAEDFEAGLSELERQRTRINEAEQRPGIFDDASELFDEIISLQLRRGAPAEEILRSVERGRARAVLEQIDAGEGRFDTPAIPRIADIQRELEPGTALVEYFSLPDRLIAFVIAPDRSVMRILPVARPMLTKAVRPFVAGQGAGGGALYEMLIAPIRSDLHGISAVNFVSDDLLQRVPFAALFDAATHTFFIQQLAIATSPSAAVLLRTLAKTRLLPPLQAPSALVFGNPAIPRGEFGDLTTLTASEYEAPKVARQYTRADVFVGEEATAERFRQLAPARDFVHFAGHGVINEREPFSSALVCAASPGRRGGLTAGEIARMKFRTTRAVVLAACSTMTGRNAAIEGVPSLSRAFIIAGVPAVVGTLWDIHDDEAVAITRPLHEQLAHGVAPAEALRRAQLAAIRRGLPVAQWSAFALMGSAPAPPAR